MPHIDEPKTALERISNLYRNKEHKELRVVIQREEERVNKIAAKWASKVGIYSLTDNAELKGLIQHFIGETPSRYAAKALSVYGKAPTSDKFSLDKFLVGYSAMHAAGDCMLENILGGDPMGPFLLYVKSNPFSSKSDLFEGLLRHTIGIPVAVVRPAGAVMQPWLVVVNAIDPTFLFADAYSLVQESEFRFHNGPALNGIVPVSVSGFGSSYLCTNAAVEVSTFLATKMPGISNTTAPVALIGALVTHLLSEYWNPKTGAVSAFASEILCVLRNTNNLYCSGNRGFNNAMYKGNMVLPDADVRCYTTGSEEERYLECASLSQIVYTLWWIMQTHYIKPCDLRKHFLATLVEMMARGVKKGDGCERGMLPLLTTEQIFNTSSFKAAVSKAHGSSATWKLAVSQFADHVQAEYTATNPLCAVKEPVRLPIPFVLL